MPLAGQSSLHQRRVGGGAASFFSSLLKAELRTLLVDESQSTMKTFPFAQDSKPSEHSILAEPPVEPAKVPDEMIYS